MKEEIPSQFGYATLVERYDVEAASASSLMMSSRVSLSMLSFRSYQFDLSMRDDSIN